MHAPKREGNSNHSSSWDIRGLCGIQNRGEQKNILQSIFKGDLAWGLRSSEEQSQLRLWKTLRELDVMPVFLPHLGRELYQLLSRRVNRNFQEEIAEAAKKAMAEVVEKRVEKRVVEVRREVPVAICKTCQEVEKKAEEVARDYRGKNSKAAKTVRRVMDKILSVWRGDK
jgi:hypothetical protein